MLSIFHKQTVDSSVLLTGVLLALLGAAGVVHAAALTVTTTADSGARSLRQAIADAASGDTINFNLSGCPCTITLTSGELVIGKNLTITGPGTDLLTISGNNASRVFFVNPGAPGATTGPPATNPVVNISRLTIANGKARGGYGVGGGGGAAGMGGGLFINGGTVTLDQVDFSRNQAIGGDGLFGRAGAGGGVGGDGFLVGGDGGSLGGNGGLWTDSTCSFDGDGGEGAGGGAGDCATGGGSGGFGGGGGGSGGNGGFGGGGGAANTFPSAGVSLGGLGGSGAPATSSVFGGGGGGAGLGGGIFVRAGLLALVSVGFADNSAAGGQSDSGSIGQGVAGNNGQGKGGALFIHAGATANACTTSFSNNSAADDLGSGTDTDDLYGVLTMESCNHAPVAKTINVTVSAGASCTANASINDGSYDPDGDTITLSQLPAGPYALGLTDVALTVTDSHGVSDSSTSAVTVEDKTQPVITLTGSNPLTLECATPFTDPGARAMDNCAAPLVTATGTVNVKVPGSYSVLYSADDGHGNIATATRTVNIADSVAPLLTLKPEVAFWTPNHNYAALTMSQMVQSSSDACNSTLTIGGVVIEKVTSDEPDNAPGNADGNTTGDILIAADCRSVQLRSERDETKNGRVYVVTLRLKDASGNATRRDFKVSVPIGQSTGPAIQGATALTSTSSCR